MILSGPIVKRFIKKNGMEWPQFAAFGAVRFVCDFDWLTTRPKGRYPDLENSGGLPVPTYAYILIAIVAVIALFLVIAATRPADFRISRLATMAAPPSAIFAQVNDFHPWDAWSPWAKIDPAMKKTYSGPPAGVGAIYEWNGNGQVGQGRMTILESKPNEVIRIKLEFFRPFKATHAAEFAFQPQGNQTVVTWTMIGHNNFILKAMGMFMSMDKMLGKEFDKGLASMKAIVEGNASAAR
jgi:hypothetical protein